MPKHPHKNMPDNIKSGGRKRKKIANKDRKAQEKPKRAHKPKLAIKTLPKDAWLPPYQEMDSVEILIFDKRPEEEQKQYLLGFERGKKYEKDQLSEMLKTEIDFLKREKLSTDKSLIPELKKSNKDFSKQLRFAIIRLQLVQNLLEREKSHTESEKPQTQATNRRMFMNTKRRF